MATDVINDKNTTEDSDMAECDEEKVVTMMDVLKEQQDFEEDANAVLGASDDKNCTFPKGYIKRQAIYACMTCCLDAKSDPSKRAGVCLACSLTCHENHELVELYTKRNFRCDCGNPKFNSHPCQFTPSKTDLNEDNNYNQNFSGLYCVCNRPYPDPDSTTEDEMIQCIMCEDWLHATHLGSKVPANDHYSEMICKGCMEKNEFLNDYSELAVNTENVDVDVINLNGSDIDTSKTCNGDIKMDEKNETLDVDKTEKIEEAEMTDDTQKTTQADTIEVNSGQDNAEQKKLNELSNVENISPKVKDLDSEKNIKDSPNTISDALPITINQETENVRDKSKEVEQSEPNQSVDSKEENINNTETQDTINESQHPDTNDESKILNKPDENIQKDSNTANETVENNDKSKEEVSNNESKDHELEQKQEETTINTNDSPNEAAKESEKQDKSETETVKNESTVEDAERMEEERLLADPDDETQQAASEKNNDKVSGNDVKKDKQNSMESEEICEKKVEDPQANLEKVPLDDKNLNKEKSVHESVSKEISSGTDNLNHISNEEHSDKKELSQEESDEKQEKETDEHNEKQENETDEPNENTKTNEDVEMAEAKDSKKSEENSESKMENEENMVSSISNGDNAEMKKESLKSDINEDSQEKNSEKRKLSVEDETDDFNHKKQKVDESEKKPCVRPKGIKRIHKGATFWPSSFRQKLCTCGECINMYKDLSVLFLIDPEDTVTAYETLGKEKINGEPASQYEKGMQALSSLDRIQQINALTEYNKMRDKLLDFLKSFKDRKEIVKEEDIKAFFAGMKPKREPDGVYFCR